mmetsp:Transcript_30736/g.73772  ORF Transcript_30736/g.73772 Transcript_30736/m.73772 type:complete len:293 (-) Transcript_30736:576-1454(-)
MNSHSISMSDGQPKTEGMMSNNQPSSASTRNAITKLTSLDQYTGLRNHRMRFQDAFDINAERVDKVSKQDVIFGRGKNLQDHPGNRRMRQITNKYKGLYRTLQKSQKRSLVETVYKEIVHNGARFLTKAPNDMHYLLVDVEVALQKISNSLRCMKQHKRQLVAAMERQSSSEQQVPISSASRAATSPILERASHQIPCKVDDQRAAPRRFLDSPDSVHLPFPNPDAIPGSKNLDILSTLQHFNQCRHLRLMMDARMKSSVPIGSSVKVPSVQPPAPRKESPGAKSNKRPSSL